MNRVLCPICLVITLSIAAPTRAATLVENGQAKAAILIPAGQKSAAAEELRHYLERASGARLAILPEGKLAELPAGFGRVFVGPCQASRRVVDLQQLQPEGFVIKTDEADSPRKPRFKRWEH